MKNWPAFALKRVRLNPSPLLLRPRHVVAFPETFNERHLSKRRVLNRKCLAEVALTLLPGCDLNFRLSENKKNTNGNSAVFLIFKIINVEKYEK